LDPAPDVDLRFLIDAYGLVQPICSGSVLAVLLSRSSAARLDMSRLPWALERLARRGRGDLALQLGDRLLLPSMAAFRHLLAANRAVKQDAPDDWLSALNAYLKAYGVDPIGLRVKKPGRLGACEARPSRVVRDGPLVSVFLSAWQAAETLEASLQSILAQGWRRLEVIALDDASSDETGAILRAAAKNDPRLRVLRNPVNVGPYVGRNIAFSFARGDWICCHDADEWAHPDRLALHMDWLLREGGPPISQIGMLRMTPEGWFGQIGKAGAHTVDGALRPCPSATLFDRDFVTTRLGSWDCARFGADSEMIARAMLATSARAPKFLAMPLVLSLDHADSLTNRLDTGTGRGGGLSPARAAYRAYWNHRLSCGSSPEHIYRAFPPVAGHDLPEEVGVPMSDIAICLETHRIK
jgi:hypothetical protein